MNKTQNTATQNTATQNTATQNTDSKQKIIANLYNTSKANKITVEHADSVKKEAKKTASKKNTASKKKDVKTDAQSVTETVNQLSELDRLIASKDATQTMQVIAQYITSANNKIVAIAHHNDKTDAIKIFRSDDKITASKQCVFAIYLTNSSRHLFRFNIHKRCFNELHSVLDSTQYTINEKAQTICNVTSADLLEIFKLVLSCYITL